MNKDQRMGIKENSHKVGSPKNENLPKKLPSLKPAEEITANPRRPVRAIPSIDLSTVDNSGKIGLGKAKEKDDSGNLKTINREETIKMNVNSYSQNIINIWDEFSDDINIEPENNPFEPEAAKTNEEDDTLFEVDEAGWKDYLKADFVKGRH